MKKLIIDLIVGIVLILMLVSVLVNRFGIANFKASLPMDFHIKMGFYEQFKDRKYVTQAVECLSPQDLLEGIRQLILPGLSIILLVIYLLLKLA